MTRKFVISPAKRERVPVLMGLCGPSGSGKTLSALRIAKGMSEVEPGKIHFIDTEGRRALHYSDDYDFLHVPFDPPFSPGDYLAVIEQCAAATPSVIIVDSTSHEHEGQGGVLEMHDAELDRMAGSDYQKRQKCNAAAWIKPKAERRKLIQRIIQLNLNMIFCFRAAEKLDWKAGASPKDLGFQPISPPAISFEMTCMALLHPGSQGKPDWKPKIDGERALVKLPHYLGHVFQDGRQMDERHGRELAKWAAGDKPTREEKPKPVARAADLTVERKKFGRMLLERTEGDTDAAKQLCKDLTGSISVRDLSLDAMASASAKVGTHPIFGDSK